MINEKEIYFEFVIIIVMMVVVMASIVIPIYGYNRKRWKGLALGCLLQPIACGVIIIALISGYAIYSNYDIESQKKSVMVTVQTVEASSEKADTLMWYIKADEECIMQKEEKESYYDVIRLDSARVGVEDRIVVSFDLKKKQVKATDLGAPIKVVNVDWDKVEAYFAK